VLFLAQHLIFVFSESAEWDKKLCSVVDPVYAMIYDSQAIVEDKHKNLRHEDGFGRTINFVPLDQFSVW